MADNCLDSLSVQLAQTDCENQPAVGHMESTTFQLHLFYIKIMHHKLCQLSLFPNHTENQYPPLPLTHISDNRKTSGNCIFPKAIIALATC